MVNQEGIPWCFPCNKSHREWDFPLNQWYEENEHLSNYEHVNLVEYVDPIYTIHEETYTITGEKMELNKQNNHDATKITRLEMLNSMDEKSKNKIRKEKYLQYTRRNKSHGYSQPSESKPPTRTWTRYPLL